MKSTTTHALKEWAIAVEALEQGTMIMLLRKGGITEAGNRFKVAHQQILLYPTYEHQQPNLLKAEYVTRVKPVSSGWHPETVRIGSWAEITDILPVREESIVTALLPYHIWNEQFVSDLRFAAALRYRLKWKPRQPLHLLLLRTYRLSSVSEIPYRSEYGGCRSWIDLLQPILIDAIVPLLNDEEYTKQTTLIHQIVMGNE